MNISSVGGDDGGSEVTGCRGWQNLASTEHLEEAKAELRKTMTVKMQKKKEATTLRLTLKAQKETATLVQRHSEQMLDLLKSKQDELAQELEEEIVRAFSLYCVH